METLQGILIILIMAFLSACNYQNGTKSDSIQNEIITSDSLNDSEELLSNFDIETKNKHSIWDYDCMKDTVMQIRNVTSDTLTHEILMNFINTDYQDKIYLEYVKTKHDTLFVIINDSHYLTQQMGTAGADDYMISATFTLTELQEVGFVNFDFEEGDHAIPGTYSRKYYLDWIRKNKNLSVTVQNTTVVNGK